MLVNGRPQMTARAVASFRAQTYENKRLVIWNTGAHGPAVPDADIDLGAMIHEPCIIGAGGETIGKLRNEACAYACNERPMDIFVTMDSDDWSGPRRIEEQVALLQASGKQCVGYREILFWDTRKPLMCQHAGIVSQNECPYCVSRDEAWFYRNPDPRWVCGASMCYWRSAWEACPFEDAPNEDQLWWLKNAEKCLGVSAIVSHDDKPRMICGIHGSNTGAYDHAEMVRGGGGVWSRASEYDGHCERVMKL